MAGLNEQGNDWTGPAWVEPTGDIRIDALLWGNKWGFNQLQVSFPRTFAEFGYAFYGGGNAPNYVPFNNTQINEILITINNISTFTNLTFNFNPNISQALGHLRFGQADAIQYSAGEQLRQIGNNSAEAVIPDPQFPIYSWGDTWYRNDSYVAPQFGNFQRAAGLMHELGHALGLKHPFSNQPDGQGRSWPAMPTEFDGQEFTIMAYSTYIGHDRANFPSGPLEYPWSFMQLDILALQYMYGANYTTANVEDTVYRFDTNTGELFIKDGDKPEFGLSRDLGVGLPLNQKVFLTIWDGGGVDTYDFSNFNNDQQIDLRPGAFSTFDPAKLSHLGDGNFARGNIANALLFNDDPRSLIDNAITGAGNDIIIGNQINNRLNGGAGNDIILGNGGNNTLIGGTGNDILDGGPGTEGQGSVLLGGPGNDTYIVRNPFDIVDEGVLFPDHAGLPGDNDTIISFTHFFWDMQGAASNHRIDQSIATTFEISAIIGNLFDNQIFGNSGTNIIFSVGGNNTITPRDGIDYIALGNIDGFMGVDTIVLEKHETGPASWSAIWDFKPGQDKIDVTDFGYSSFAQIAPLGFNDGAGSSYYLLGDGADVLFFVGLTTSQVGAGDFIV